jgi:TPR repeat protein
VKGLARWGLLGLVLAAVVGAILFVVLQGGDEELAEAVPGEDPAAREAARAEGLERMTEFVAAKTPFAACEAEDLRPFDEVVALPASERAEIDREAERRAADELFRAGTARYRGGDIAAANYLFLKAAEAGSAEAMNEVGATMLNCYDGVRQDVPGARRWLARAAEAGDPLATGHLGRLYLLGAGGRLDQARGLVLISQCAELGDEECQQEMGFYRGELDFRAE